MGDTFTYITNRDELSRLEAAFENNAVLFCDLETTDLSPHSSTILLISIATYHDGVFVISPRDVEEVYELLAVWAAREDRVWVFHNAVFDLQHLRKQGVECVNSYCTMVAEQVLKAGLLIGGFSLQDVAQRRLRIEMDKTVRQGFIGMDSRVFTYEQLAYAAQDTAVLLPVYVQQQEEITKQELLDTILLEMSLLPITAKMEYDGVAVDVLKLRAAIPAVNKLIQRAYSELQAFALGSGFATQFLVDKRGFHVVNPSSVPQMLTFLNHMGVDVESVSEKELSDWDLRWQMRKKSAHDKQFLERLAQAQQDIAQDGDGSESNEPDLGFAHPFLNIIAVYKATQKLRSTYYESLLAKVSPVTHRIHPRFNQCGAVATGRFSSSNPNFQNLPNRHKLKSLGLEEYDVRSVFISQPNTKFIISDYSGIELAILAAASGDENLTYQIISGDIHSYVANTLFGDQIESILGSRITKENKGQALFKNMRDTFKPVSYAICYGSTGWNIYRTLSAKFSIQGFHITQEMTDEWVERWKHELFPNTGKLFERNALSAVTKFYTSSSGGRRRYWNPTEIRSSPKAYSAARREGMNQPIQATSADMIKRSMVVLSTRLHPVYARLVACVHDELIIQAHDRYVSYYVDVVKDVMEGVGRAMFPDSDPRLIAAEPKVSERYDK